MYVPFHYCYTEETDYSVNMPDLVLATMETSVCTSITITQDTDFEGTEAFNIVFSNANANVIFNADSARGSSSISAQISILDNSGQYNCYIPIAHTGVS